LSGLEFYRRAKEKFKPPPVLIDDDDLLLWAPALSGTSRTTATTVLQPWAMLCGSSLPFVARVYWHEGDDCCLIKKKSFSFSVFFNQNQIEKKPNGLFWSGTVKKVGNVVSRNVQSCPLLFGNLGRFGLLPETWEMSLVYERTDYCVRGYLTAGDALRGRV